MRLMDGYIINGQGAYFLWVSIILILPVYSCVVQVWLYCSSLKCASHIETYYYRHSQLLIILISGVSISQKAATLVVRLELLSRNVQSVKRYVQLGTHSNWNAQPNIILLNLYIHNIVQVLYCSIDCQKLAWTVGNHKKLCKKWAVAPSSETTVQS